MFKQLVNLINLLVLASKTNFNFGLNNHYTPRTTRLLYQELKSYVIKTYKITFNIKRNAAYIPRPQKNSNAILIVK